MLRPRLDDVSNIHRRWSFTRINPSSSKVSYAIWAGCAALIIILFQVYNLSGGTTWLIAVYLPLGLATLVGSHFVDYLALSGTPVKKLSKIAHVSAFANILWTLTIALGIAADLLFSKRPDMDYVIAGMLLAVGLRIGILTSVFGASTRRAILVAFIQPVMFFFSFVPPSLYPSIGAQSSLGILFGTILIALSVVWTTIADKAGRPGVKSTFGLLRAFLAAWTENRVEMMEELLEAKAHNRIVTTKIIQFHFDGSQAAIVLPDVHPGPFSMVGGSNLPYALYETFSKKALIMHSVSDHSLNIPSTREVRKYVKDLQEMIVTKKGGTCAGPIQIKKNESTSTGIAFANTAIVMLSLAPKGMEDIPQSMRTELESYGEGLGFSDVLVVDCHNAMGSDLENSDRGDLLASARECLEQLIEQPQKEFKIGFASLDSINYKLARTNELGGGGLAALVISINDKKYAIGWADSNNMNNATRNYVVSRMNDWVTMLELCSSDTHSTSGKRTREGYFALGDTTRLEDILLAYKELCSKAAETAATSTFEVAHKRSDIMVMGKKLFEDYSMALDRSMNVTKVFITITIVTYILMLVLS